nr:recombinase family protein [Chitinophaga pinensis]
MNNQIHKSITLKTTTMITQRNAFLYPRVSTDEQVDGYSLAHQEDVLIRYCEKENIQVVGIYREGHSAKTFDRTEFQRCCM